MTNSNQDFQPKKNPQPWCDECKLSKCECDRIMEERREQQDDRRI
jgi:hypothetical protein